MNIVMPIAVTSGMVTTNAANAHADYAAGTTYASGAQVTYNLKTWLSLQDSNTGHTPGAAGSEAWWSDAGPSNKWAMFDGEVGTVTTRADSLAVTITPIGAPTVALLNVRAKTAQCVSTHGVTEVYNKTVSLWDTSLISDWAEYFFSEPEFRTEAIFEGLPNVPGQSVTLTLSATGATAQCGMCVPGVPFDVGSELQGIKRSGTDYSTVTFDTFGAATIKRRGYARKVSTQTVLPNTAFDRIARRLDQIASVPVLVLSGQPRFGATVVYGLVSYTLDLPLYSYSYASIEVKGLI